MKFFSYWLLPGVHHLLDFNSRRIQMSSTTCPLVTAKFILISCPDPGPEVRQVRVFKHSGLEDPGAGTPPNIVSCQTGGGGGRGVRGEWRQQTTFPRQWLVCGARWNSEGPGAFLRKGRERRQAASKEGKVLGRIRKEKEKIGKEREENLRGCTQIKKEM